MLFILVLLFGITPPNDPFDVQPVVVYDGGTPTFTFNLKKEF